MEAILFVGIQGSGKTTFYKERFFETHVRVSRDMVKTQRRERLLADACLAGKLPFVVDNTNSLATQRAEHIAPAKAAGFRVVGFYFRCNLADALRRNRQRPEGRVIPAAGVAATFKRLQPPSWSEGFDDLRVVEIDEANRFVVREWNAEEGEPPRP
jgi:predicted kinase